MTASTGHYLPIADYGVIGNLRTVALVGRNGSIDWCCFPRFDSPSLFAAILDHRIGGHFRITAPGAGLGEQRYLGDTNVLLTRFRTDSGAVTVTDWMPIRGELEGSRGSAAEPEIRRVVECGGGASEVELEWSPRFDYARASTRIQREGGGAIASAGDRTASLAGSLTDAAVVDGGGGPSLRARFTIEPGQALSFACRWDSTDTRFGAVDALECRELSAAAWRGWVRRGNSACPDSWAGQWRDLVVRSSLALKLMIHDEGGGIVAAPTTSLPEEIGGIRNWDYRYSWIRDSAQTADALFALGHDLDARDYVLWSERTARRGSDEIDIKLMYDLDGEYEIPESELDHLEGYRGSRPVRIGNAAADQLQLDIYGELMQAAYELVRADHELEDGVADFLGRVADSACAGWHRPDHGIWEVRQEVRHYVNSKLMVWVALDRALALVRRGVLTGDVARWRDSAAQVKRSILERGYDDEIGSFVQSYGSQHLDATSLLIPVQELLPVDDPRVQSTIDRTLERLTVNGLVYRYRADDGLEGEEGSFGLCTFWMVDALALSKRLDEANEIFEGMARRANHVGLFSEEIDPHSGEFLGNFPQAFTHVGLINSALYLADAEGGDLPLPSLVGTPAHRAEIGRDG
jgi:GH15 family glucan-1,4-alpha-glucosidase